VSAVEEHNRRFWSRGTELAFYDSRDLRPVEVVLLVRHRDALSGRVLELGSGAGRLTSYLVGIASELHAVDVSAAMLDRCKANAPGAITHLGDLRDLSAFADASFGAIVAPYNVVDVLDDRERGALLDDLRRLLTNGGLLVFSTHNRAAADDIRPPWALPGGGPRARLRWLRTLRQATANHRRLARQEVDAPDHAIRNDSAHDYALLHYYIDRDAQQRQLEAHGLELLECLELGGRLVGPGERAPHCHELHYVARRAGQGR